MSVSRRHIVSGLAVVTLGLAVSPRPANACTVALSPPRRPGETDEDLKARMEAEWQGDQRRNQQSYWARADSVFIARRIESPEPPSPLPERPYDPRRDGPPRPPRLVRPSLEITSAFQPVTALKGPLPPLWFSIRYEPGGSSCGPFILADAIYAEIGDLVVVFQKGRRPIQENLLEAIKPGRILAPEIRTALDRRP